jgi:hypothetical protein
MKLLSTTAAAVLALGSLGGIIIGCGGDDEPGGTNGNTASVVGVYEALNVADLAPNAIARLALAEGQYLLFSAECVRSKAGGCEREGKYSFNATRDRIDLVDNRDGTTSSLPFTVLSVGTGAAANNGVRPKGICIGTESECDAKQGGQTLIVGDQSPDEIVKPGGQIVIQCTGNCAMTIKVNGQELTTTGESLNVTVPTK